MEIVLAVLFNCCEPESITKALSQIAKNPNLSQRLHGHYHSIHNASKILLGAYPNRLTAVDPNWTLANSNEPQPFRQDLNEKDYWEKFVSLWINTLGVQIVGGCCGITPEHIHYIYQQLAFQKRT